MKSLNGVGSMLILSMIFNPVSICRQEGSESLVGFADTRT